ncbi:lasso peptide biosynthesis PqqD family chaperone [Streptomyces sp. NPDC021100]|uniref:lasso peptide biosynthesis PqqD family chaperone n=1 Tax=Streptomyces sp. NPDC021100 TaxID=3365114 RepID=UPI0037AECAAA
MRLRSGVALTSTDYGAVLLDERDGTYWQLNDSGAVIVSALAEGLAPGAVAERLAAEFDVDAAEAEADVRELVRQLVEAKIVRP